MATGATVLEAGRINQGAASIAIVHLLDRTLKQQIVLSLMQLVVCYKTQLKIY